MTWSKTKPDYEEGTPFWAISGGAAAVFEMQSECVIGVGQDLDWLADIEWWGPPLVPPERPKTIADLERDVIDAAVALVVSKPDKSDVDRVCDAVKALQEEQA